MNPLVHVTTQPAQLNEACMIVLPAVQLSPNIARLLHFMLINTHTTCLHAECRPTSYMAVSQKNSRKTIFRNVFICTRE